MLKLVLDYNDYKQLSDQKDARIEIWRRPAGAANFYLDGDTFYSLRMVELREERNRIKTITLYAYDTIALLKRRAVLYKAGSAQAQKTGAIDDLSKNIVTENFISPTDPLRVMTGLSIRAALTQAPSTTKGFSNRYVLDILQDLAAESYSKGTYLAFDIIWFPNDQSLKFATFINQRGVNRSITGPNAGLVLDSEWNTLTDIVKVIDWRDEATIIQANGPGQDADRLSAQAPDNTRLFGTSIGRTEIVIDARMAVDQAGTQAEADAALREYRKRTYYTARAVDSDQIRFGAQYGGGDKVTANIFGDSIDVRVEAYTIDVDSNGESITVKLEAAV